MKDNLNLQPNISNEIINYLIEKIQVDSKKEFAPWEKPGREFYEGINFTITVLEKLKTKE